MVMKDDCRWWAQNIRIMYHRNLYLKPTVFCHLKCVFCPNFLGKNMHVHYTWVNDYTPWGQHNSGTIIPCIMHTKFGWALHTARYAMFALFFSV